MAVFASLTGRLAQLVSPTKNGNMLKEHVGAVPNPISKRSKELQPPSCKICRIAIAS